MHGACICLVGSCAIIAMGFPGLTVVSDFPFHFEITML